MEREKTEETGRDRKMDLDTVEKLPFSKVEAYRICSRTGGRMYTGAAATKNVVLSAHGYKNINIATHGYFDMENQEISLYSSWLAFTGIKNTSFIPDRQEDNTTSFVEVRSIRLTSSAVSNPFP